MELNQWLINRGQAGTLKYREERGTPLPPAKKYRLDEQR